MLRVVLYMAMPLGVAGEFRVCEYVILKKKGQEQYVFSKLQYSS
jgi:hypothetical protein